MDKLNEDTSVVIVQNGSFDDADAVDDKNGKDVQTSGDVGKLLSHSATLEGKGKKSPRRGAIKRPPIKYAAKQVIKRGGIFEPDSTLPTGTNLIGKLLTAIDTREKGQIYKVLLPYGGKSKAGAEIPKNTVVHGKIRYPGRGKKVFIQFTQGVFPDGREFKLEAQALNTGNYSPGIEGDFHGKGGVRLATTLGLTMVSGMTDVMTEKKEIGKNGAVAPKATLKNGFYQGLSQATQLEATRQASELNADPEYVTVESGTDLIVSLTRSFKNE